MREASRDEKAVLLSPTMATVECYADNDIQNLR